MDDLEPKELIWIGSSRKDLKDFPLAVRRAFGIALYAAQIGEWPPDAKPLKGFGGTGVLEIIEDHRGDTYRAGKGLRKKRRDRRACPDNARRAGISHPRP